MKQYYLGTCQHFGDAIIYPPDFDWERSLCVFCSRSSAREALINAAMRSFAAYTKPQEV